MSINPDFKSADEVIVPDDAQFGWTDGSIEEADALDQENRYFAEIEESAPMALRSPQDIPRIRPEVLAKWQEFQKSKGRFSGSNDLTLLDEFVFGKDLSWHPQIIGSCVASNTFPRYVEVLAYQIAMAGDPYEHLGKNEFGQNNIAPFAAWSYGKARKRANMRGGDGLYCAPMAASLVLDGVLQCNAPGLRDLLISRSLNGDQHYPEPQGAAGARLYRDMGNWRYLDQFQRYADFPAIATPKIQRAEQLWEHLGNGHSAFVCSGEAIHKVGMHRDGFPIHARNPRNSWAHNMGMAGRWVASDGARFFREANTSWGPSNIYNREFDEVDRALQTGRLNMVAIAGVRGPASSPPMV